jgi:hypothetical protein
MPVLGYLADHGGLPFARIHLEFLLLGQMCIVGGTIGPGAGMAAEPNSYIGTVVIVRASLDDLWPVFFELTRGFLRRAHDGDVPGNVRIRVGINDQDQTALIRQRLRALHAGYPPPPLLLRGCAVEPLCWALASSSCPCSGGRRR